VGFAELVSDLGPLVGRAAVVEALETLARRSLLEPVGHGTLTLQPMVLEYATALLVERGGNAAGMGQGRHAVQPGASARALAATMTLRGATASVQPAPAHPSHGIWR
jgi:hypothetical protein